VTAPRSLLADIRSAFDDADAVTLDMLRPLRRRNLGPAEHRRLYREARNKLAALLATPDNDGDEHGDPAGSGGSGAE
jgi:hypothetical protein